MYLKTILLVLLLSLCISGVEAQQPTATTSLEEQAAGYQLRLASKHYYTGVILEGSGTLVLLVGAASHNTGITAIGSLASLVGLGFILESYSHINKAGKILMGNAKFGLGPTQSGGIGLSYNF